MIQIGKIDLENARDFLAEIKPGSIKAATVRAIRRTGQGVAARVVKQVRDQRLTKAPAADLKKLVSVQERFATSPVFATVCIQERTISARHFFGRIVKRKWRRGVQVTILGRSYVAGFPLNVIGPGKLKGTTSIGPTTQIFRRNGTKAIRKVHGASLADLVRFSSLEGETRQYIAERLSRELAHELKRVKKG